MRSYNFLGIVGRPSPIHTLLCFVSSGRDNRLVRGPADQLAGILPPIARVGATVTEDDPMVGAVIGGREMSNLLEGITPSATVREK